jgi:superfamily II DNA or RNA helicase
MQRVGRILRKSEGKRSALIYTVYLSDTHDFTHLGVVRKATQSASRKREFHDNYAKNSHGSTNENTRLDHFFDLKTC